MKRLVSIELGKNGKQGFGSIFQDYHLKVESPVELYHYGNACLHLKLENPNLAEALKSLPKHLEAHNLEVDSAETNLIGIVNNIFTSNKLTHDRTGHYLENILKVLRIVWRANNGDLVRSSNKTGLLNYFATSIVHTEHGDALYMGDTTQYPVWRGSEEEKTAVIQSMRIILVDSTILNDLNKLEDSRIALVNSLSRIKELAGRLSKTIEAADYTAKAKCCPTILGMVRDYFF